MCIYIYRKGNPGRPPHGCFTSPNDPSTSARMITGTNGNGINGVLGSHRLQAFNPCTLYSQEGPTGFPLPPFPEIYVYIYMCVYIWMVTPSPPPRSTPASSTRFHRLLLYIGPLLIYAENTVDTDAIVLFAMCMQTVLLQVAGWICV